MPANSIEPRRPSTIKPQAPLQFEPKENLENLVQFIWNMEFHTNFTHSKAVYFEHQDSIFRTALTTGKEVQKGVRGANSLT